MYTQQYNHWQHQAACKGFTLIELLVVMVVAAVLASVAIPSFISIKANNELTTAQEDIAQMLRSAKSSAQARSTFASVAISPGTPPTVTLTLQDGSAAAQTLTLPASILYAGGALTFTFSSAGYLVGDTSIVLGSTTVPDTRTINVSPLGSIEILRN